jgi:drug/metabolite transporter (DMT)-like permease
MTVATVYLFQNDPENRPRYHPLFWAITFFDLVGNLLSNLCVIYVGAMLYVILYSSVTIFSALLQRIILKKMLNTWQWVAIVLITAGLVVSAVGGTVS